MCGKEGLNAMRTANAKYSAKQEALLRDDRHILYNPYNSKVVQKVNRAITSRPRNYIDMYIFWKNGEIKYDYI